MQIFNTWLTARVDESGVKATMHAATIDDDGLTAAESYELGAVDNLQQAYLDNKAEAEQRALEVGFSSARTRRLELNGGLGANGSFN